MISKKIQSIFWYTDNKKIDKKRDQSRIILQILQFGDKCAVAWMYKNYSKLAIKKVLLTKGGLELDKKSLNYWSLIFKLDQKKIKTKRI